MGNSRNIYLTDDNIAKLKEIKNMSQLINELLAKHFESIDPNSMTSDQIRAMLAKEDLKKEYITKLKEINKKWNIQEKN